MQVWYLWWAMMCFKVKKKSMRTSEILPGEAFWLFVNDLKFEMIDTVGSEVKKKSALQLLTKRQSAPVWSQQTSTVTTPLRQHLSPISTQEPQPSRNKAFNTSMVH